MSTIRINNNSYVGNSVVITNGKVIINGKDVTPDSKEINITVSKINEYNKKITNSTLLKSLDFYD